MARGGKFMVLFKCLHYAEHDIGAAAAPTGLYFFVIHFTEFYIFAIFIFHKIIILTRLTIIFNKIKIQSRNIRHMNQWKLFHSVSMILIALAWLFSASLITGEQKLV